VRRFASASGTIVVDDRYLPILLHKWQGRVEAEEAREFINYMIELLEQAQARGEVVINVSEGLEAERPDPVTRKVVGEMSDIANQRFPETLMQPGCVVLESRVLRGVITALGWITRRGLTVTTHATLPEAILDAMDRLAAKGVPLPEDLDPYAYRFPSPSADSAAS
jgi:hypothetical protein